MSKALYTAYTYSKSSVGSIYVQKYIKHCDSSVIVYPKERQFFKSLEMGKIIPKEYSVILEYDYNMYMWYNILTKEITILHFEFPLTVSELRYMINRHNKIINRIRVKGVNGISLSENHIITLGLRYRICYTDLSVELLGRSYDILQIKTKDLIKKYETYLG